MLPCFSVYEKKKICFVRIYLFDCCLSFISLSLHGPQVLVGDKREENVRRVRGRFVVLFVAVSTHMISTVEALWTTMISKSSMMLWRFSCCFCWLFNSIFAASDFAFWMCWHMFFFEVRKRCGNSCFYCETFFFFCSFLSKIFEHFERLIEKSFFDHFCGMPQRRHPNVINKRFKEKGYIYICWRALDCTSRMQLVSFQKKSIFFFAYFILCCIPPTSRGSVASSPWVLLLWALQRDVVQKSTLSNEKRRSAKRRMHHPDEAIACFMLPANQLFLAKCSLLQPLCLSSLGFHFPSVRFWRVRQSSPWWPRKQNSL